MPANDRMAQMQTAGNDTLSRTGGIGSMEIGGLHGSCSGDLLLVQEMAHRINNELTSTISFVSLTAARSVNGDVKVALAGVLEHLFDHARIYRALQMPTANRWIDAAAYLRELCQAISRSKLQHRGIELVLVEHPLQLSSTQCWRLGLIVSELITNSCRHAFAGGGGSIRVELEKRGRRVECRVTDDGSGAENIRPGQGLKIIQNLARGLNGEIDHRFGDNGVAAIVSFPIAEPIEGS
jgi:two-component sensor histidine kinase